MADFTPGTWSPSRHPLPAKRKFHFCIGEVLEGEVLGFLFLSSLARGADLVLANADIPCLPPNKTGETCVGLAMLIRIRLDALPRFYPQRLGRVDAPIIRRIEFAVRDSVAPTPAEKRLVLAGLAKVR